MKAAVIYYSKSGTTERIAKKIQNRIDADLYFIEPDKRYGGYLSSVISVAGEKLMQKPAKPKTAAADFSEYDVIFIGFPVWYSTAPQFVQDYIKACKLSGKRIIPFATAGANGKDSSCKTVKELLPGCNITDYFFTSKVKEADADAWLDGISF